ncbi:hypothetical protein ES705_18379 [subsurface metagenome]
MIVVAIKDLAVIVFFSVVFMPLIIVLVMCDRAVRWIWRSR